MKNIASLVIGTLLFLTSCSSDRIVDMPDTSIVVGDTNYSYTGNFVSQAHSTSGTAKIVMSNNQLNLETFKTDSGPKLNIYLASNINSIKSDYKDLGAIKGINGNYSYAIPANIDFAKYKYVVVWCVDFDVNFGYATLNK